MAISPVFSSWASSQECTAGLKFGIYSDAGFTTCLGYPGGRFHEQSDAESFADWDVDFLKYDNCAAAASDWVVDRYTAMRDALNATGRPILYSLCVWGVADPWIWAQDVSLHCLRSSEFSSPHPPPHPHSPPPSRTQTPTHTWAGCPESTDCSLCICFAAGHEI